MQSLRGNPLPLTAAAALPQPVVRGRHPARPRPISTVETHETDSNRFGDADQDGVERVIRHMLAGSVLLRLHGPLPGPGRSLESEATPRALRLLESLAKPWEMAPAPPAQPGGTGHDRVDLRGRGPVPR